MPVLSYIIPVFNGGKCVSYCLDSIYSLPLHEGEFEVIVVNDCSTDDSMQVLRDYASKHSNMIVLHQEVNRRQGAARNRGIDTARGEYIAFCDADDTIVAGGVMNALKAVSETKADICYFDFEYEQPMGEWHLLEMPKETRNAVMSSFEYLEKYYTCLYNGPVRNLYRRDFLQSTGIRFVEGVRWEDCDWTVKVYAKAKQIQFVDGVGYRYASNEKSTSKLRSPEAMSERVYAGLRLMDFGDEISTTFPKLSKIVSEEGRNYYVANTIRLRNLTKYNVLQIKEFYSRLGEERRTALLKYSWSGWETLFLSHKLFSLFLLFWLCPMVSTGRKVVRLIRNNR